MPKGFHPKTEFKKGQVQPYFGGSSWNKGIKNPEWSIEMKKRGFVPPSRKGSVMSEEQKKLLSENSPKFWLGKKRSEETKRKISKSRIGRYAGVNHPNWQGGITPENHKIRASLEMKLFKKAVFERDNFTCQKTGQVGGKLVVHHINNFADFPELRTSISNGITLSKESHLEFHKIYGKRNNTREQLLEFLTKEKLCQ